MHQGFRATVGYLGLGAALLGLLLGTGCSSSPRFTRGVSPQGPARTAPAVRGSVTGKASYYGPGFHGRITASGERFDQEALTAAHRTLPFGTRVRVTNLSNGKSVLVRINDRGPFKRGRILDLSMGAARRIGMVKTGTARVRLEIME